MLKKNKLIQKKIFVRFNLIFCSKIIVFLDVVNYWKGKKKKKCIVMKAKLFVKRKLWFLDISQLYLRNVVECVKKKLCLVG